MATTASQLITRVDFVPFSTRDINAACAFYGTTLGLAKSVYVPERNYAEFETGNVTISIVDGEKMGIGHHVNTIALALHVDDVAAAREILEGRGVQFHGETLDTGVCHMSFFSDPDGNALMLHHRYAPRAPESSAHVAHLRCTDRSPAGPVNLMREEDLRGVDAGHD